MSLKEWEKRVLKPAGASTRVAQIEGELRLAAGLTALREDAGYSQRELARRMGVSQPRIVAIEQSRNVTLDVLEQYVGAIGGKLEVTVVKGKSKIPLLSGHLQRSAATSSKPKRSAVPARKPSRTGASRRAARSA